MNVLLTGGSGFTGSHLLEKLVATGIRPRCLVRAGSNTAAMKAHGLEIVTGDIGDAASLDVAFRGIDVLLNTASIGFGHAPVLVEAAERAGVRRAVFVSTTAIFTTLNASSKSVRVAAEDRIRASNLGWTIVRPTMIYGTVRDRNLSRLVRLVKRWPVIPVAGSGKHLQQPVYVDDVAEAVLLAAKNDVAIRRAYNIAGAAPLTFNEVIDTIARLLGKRVLKLHLPVRPLIPPLQLLERMGVRAPVKAEQLLRLNEHKAFDYDEAARELGYSPITFEEGMRRELASMNLLPQ